MSELPEGWITARIEEIAEVRSGRQRSPDKAFGPYMRPYLRAANVTWAGLDLTDVKEMNFEPHELATYVLQKGDILLTEASGSPAEIGKPAVFNGEIVDCCFQNHLIRVRAVDGLFPFLYQRFFYDAISGAFAQVSRGLGIHNIGRETIAKWEVDLPPPEEQRRIVDKIEVLAAYSRSAKQDLAQIPALLEEFRLSVLAAAFRGDLTQDWREENPVVESAAELLTRIRLQRRRLWEKAELTKMLAKGKEPRDDRWKEEYKEPEPVDTSNLPDLPEGWCWASLDEVRSPDAPIVYGIILPGDDVPDGIPYVRPIDITEDGRVDLMSLKRTTVEIAAQYSRAGLKAGDVILSIVGTIGKVVVTPEALEGGNITQSSVRIRPPAEMSSDYVRHALESPQLRAQYDLYRFGNAVQRLNVDHVRKLVMPLAPVDEQKAMVRRLAGLLQCFPVVSVTALQESLVDLDRTILAKAFRGELVPQDPGDEPAATLLARIRAERAEAATKPSPERPKAPVKRPAMINQDMKDRIRVAIQDQAFDRFSFDELRRKVPGNYDTVKDSLFDLLRESTPVVRQFYDKQAKTTRLERVRS